MAADVQPDTAAAAIIREEEELHARVQARAASDLTREGGPNVSAAYDRDLIELRDAIAEAKPEDLPPLVEQMTRLAALRGHVGGSQTLPIDTASPYFAHMTLREPAPSGSRRALRRRDVLIGKRGYIDRKSNIQIVDWRNAPISQIYYRYDEGDDYEEEIAGRVASGVVDVRRNVSIARARLRRIGAPQGTFVRGRDGVWHHASGEASPTLSGGQGSAARAPRQAPRRIEAGRRKKSRLGADSEAAPRADKHLPEIAALIDKEQFDLITRPSAGIVAIQGGAGSGKTTVALHRIAYLAFADQRFRPRSLLFVVPTLALARYVADVLPSLGVHGVPVQTYREWAQRLRQRLLPGSGGKYNDATPEAVSRVKKHPRIERALAAQVDAQRAAIEGELAEIATGDAAAALARWRDMGDAALIPRLRRLQFWTRKAGLPPVAAVRLDSAIRRWLRRADDIAADWGELFTDAGKLGEALGGVASASDVAATVSWSSDQLRERESADVEAIDGRDIDEDSPAGRWDIEDDPLLLRLIQLKRGGLFDPKGNQVTYQHVAIDEAQDRSAIEIRILIEAVDTGDASGERRRPSVTLAGDMAQRVVFDNGIDSWEQLLRAVGLAGTEVSPLRISYRSTGEVMQLARQILGPELDSGEPLVARSGAPVEIHELGDVGEAVAFLGDALRSLMGREPTASAVVLARYPEQADAYYAGLQRAEVPRLRRVRRDDFAFQPGIDVTEVSQVKGLEFDYVVMVDVNAASYPDNRESRHLLHIGATRAAHQLWLVPAGDASPLIPADE
jgi:DNA helicase-2/ATP-dependent DNA helicase PcrA